MTAIIARLILAMLLLPVTAAVFVLSFAATVPGGGPPSAGRLLALWTFIYSFIAVYWILLWRSSVRWTNQRITRTVLAGLGSVTAGLFVGAAAVTLFHGLPVPIAILFGGGPVPIIWVLATVLIWRETPAERVERMGGLIGADAIVCPMCGYNLSGLREARCPECGATYTLDRLIAAQPHRDAQSAEL
jgi:hypothetical protein